MDEEEKRLEQEKIEQQKKLEKIYKNRRNGRKNRN